METVSNQNEKAWIYLFVAWLVAMISILGSLFFSEIMQYPPCILCWYQRICMYPLGAMIIAGLFPFEKKVVRFSMPLVVVGMVIAFYHNLLYYKILPESASPCKLGISCTTVHLEWLGFITIPLLSFLGFLFVFVLLLFTHRNTHEK